MTNVRQGAAGATRTCPHCRETILESASVCPACKKHLRFDARTAERTAPGITPLSVEGTIRHPGGEAWEYTMIASIRNARGEEVARKVIGIGALQPDEVRTFSVAVEMRARR